MKLKKLRTLDRIITATVLAVAVSGCAKDEGPKPSAAVTNCEQATIDAYQIMNSKAPLFAEKQDLASAQELSAACLNYQNSVKAKSCSVAEKATGKQILISADSNKTACADAQKIVSAAGEDQKKDETNPDNGGEVGDIKPPDDSKLEPVDGRLLKDLKNGLRILIKDENSINLLLAGGISHSIVQGKVIKFSELQNSDLGFCFLNAGNDFGQAQAGQIIELQEQILKDQTVVYAPKDDRKIVMGCGGKNVNNWTIQNLKEIFGATVVITAAE